jgi:hypothetical protein
MGWHPGIEMRSPVGNHLQAYATANVKTRPLRVALEDAFKGETLALCGAGPSLPDHINGVDRIFACNSALPWLVERGVPVTAGVGIDQTRGMITEWADPPDVPYFLASTVDPELVKHLQSHGREVVFFHNCVGFKDEFKWYCEHWPGTYLVGRGWTVVGRFIGLAEWMGFERIDIYGADHAFSGAAPRGTPAGAHDTTHANGTLASEAYTEPLIMEGEIDGRVWRTRPDMLMAAVDLARQVNESDGRIRLMGDTLPAALLDKDDAFLDQVIRSLAPDEVATAQLV